MINYDRNLFAILIIYLMRIAPINCQLPQYSTSSTSTLRPFWKFTSYQQGDVHYQCYQKCIPTVTTDPQAMIELCNKICPFQPNIPECSECSKVYAQITQPTQPEEFVRRALLTQPESIVVEPQSHAIIFKPEIVVVGREIKQCCYLDQCETVPLESECDTRCYEPCDQPCTGRCSVNPQCPNQCEAIRRELFKIKYKIWLSQKLNQIKQKYRAMAADCLLRTRMAFTNEIHSLNHQAIGVLNSDENSLPSDGLTGDILSQMQSPDEDEMSSLNKQPMMSSSSNEDDFSNDDYDYYYQ